MVGYIERHAKPAGGSDVSHSPAADRSHVRGDPRSTDARTARSRDDAARRRTARRRTANRAARHLRRAFALAGSQDAAGARSRAARSMRSIAGASTCSSGSATERCCVHLGMTGSLRLYRHAAAPAAARPHRHRARRRRAASLPRSAALRRDALGRRRGAASAARATRSRAVRRRVLGRLPVCEDPRPPRVDQGHADGQPRRRRRGEHLRQRIAVPRRHPARDAGRPAVATAPRSAWSTRSARCWPRRSPRAAARCATSSIRPGSRALSSSITAFTGARDCRAASAGRPSAPPASASARRSTARAARRAEAASPASEA